MYLFENDSRGEFKRHFIQKEDPERLERHMTGDIDGNGTDDALVDFGAQGLWALMNNTTWVKRHGFNPDGMATGNIDGL